VVSLSMFSTYPVYVIGINGRGYFQNRMVMLERVARNVPRNAAKPLTK
jgi:hypothetical protein